MSFVKNPNDNLLCTLEEIKKSLNQANSAPTPSSCTNATYTKLCELNEILDALNNIKIQINGDDIAINMNLNDLEVLSNQLNAIQTEALDNLKLILEEVKRGVDCNDPQFVSVCNQIDISGLQLTLDAIKINTDDIELILKDILLKQDKELVQLIPIEGCANNIKWFARTYKIFDSEKNLQVSETTEYSQDGLTGWTSTNPTGFVLGRCTPCLTTKQFEFGYYKTLENKTVVDTQGFKQGVNAEFSNSYGGSYEVYFRIDGVEQFGNGQGTGYLGDYPVIFNSLQSIANYLNNHPSNTTPKDKWLVDLTVGSEGLFLEGGFNGLGINHQWSPIVVAHYDSSNNNDYNVIKSDTSPVTVEYSEPETCRKIEILKELDCNNNLRLFGFEIDGSVIDNFDTKLLLAEQCLSKVNEKVIQGVVLDILPNSSNTYYIGGTEVSDFMITNLTSGIIEVNYNTSFSASGNKKHYIANGQTLNLNSKDVSDIISAITINELEGYTGKVIVNTTRF